MGWIMAICAIVYCIVATKGKEEYIKAISEVNKQLQDELNGLKVELEFYKADNLKMHRERQ